MEFHSEISEISELEFIDMTGSNRKFTLNLHQFGGADDVSDDIVIENVEDTEDVKNDVEILDNYEADFKQIFENAKEYGKRLEQIQQHRLADDDMMGGHLNQDMIITKMGNEMFGGRPLNPVMRSLLELSSIIRQTGSYKKVKLPGVAKLIWDDAIIKSSSKDHAKIMAVASELAEHPQMYVNKYQKIHNVGEHIMSAGTFKGVKPMDVGKLAWADAVKQAGTSTDLDKIEQIALNLAKNAQHYVTKSKELKKAKTAHARVNKSFY